MHIVETYGSSRIPGLIRAFNHSATSRHMASDEALLATLSRRVIALMILAMWLACKAILQ